jgi:cytochrome c oxidase assembly protein subunit 15
LAEHRHSVIAKTLRSIAVGLAFVVVVLGAFVRLSDAGLGCPDWPGCYGHIGVPSTASEVDRANTAFPDRPVDASKAVKEMAHRYFAGALGVVVLI